MRIELLETLVYYDFPQLFIGQSESEEKLLCLAYTDENYLAVKVENSILNNFKSGKIDLLSIYKSDLEKEFYKVSGPIGIFYIGEKIDFSDIKPSMLPDSGFYL